MVTTLQTLVALLLVAAAVAMVGTRLRVPVAIPLVLTGVGLALIPGLPKVELAPELVLLLILPPLIYTASVAMSWREFCFNLRPIALLAIGCVIFTAGAVAAAVHFLFAVPWAVGFVLGAIIAPPDTVAPLAIARRLQLPHRLLVILEGEGLANDATALTLYRFAVAAVSAGVFSFEHALATFGLIVVGEIGWGIVVGWATLHLRRWVHEPRIEIMLSLLTPYIAFWVPEHLGGSGVLATVAAGLYIGWHGPKLISAATRLQGIFFWDFLTYLIESLIFLITGLQARTLIERMGWPTLELLVPAMVVTAVIIVARFMWVFPAIYVPRWVSPSLRVRDPAPPWQWAFMISFIGIRGVVSLAAALALPLVVVSGQAFPDRDMILFLTFCVILFTLVVQGLLLPAVCRALGLAHVGRREHQAERKSEFLARHNAIQAALDRLETLAHDRELPEDVVTSVGSKHRDRLLHMGNRVDSENGRHPTSDLRDDLELLIIEAERAHVNAASRAGNLSDERRRRIERELDLREANLLHQHDEDPLLEP